LFIYVLIYLNIFFLLGSQRNLAIADKIKILDYYWATRELMVINADMTVDNIDSLTLAARKTTVKFVCQTMRQTFSPQGLTYMLENEENIRQQKGKKTKAKTITVTRGGRFPEMEKLLDEVSPSCSSSRI
jgi:hypothetical protein